MRNLLKILTLLFLCTPFSAFAAITFVASGSSTYGSGTTQTLSLAAGSATDNILIVVANNAATTAHNVSTCDFNGTPLTLAVTSDGTYNDSEIWYVKGITGTHTITCNWGSSGYTGFSAAVYSGVDQTTPIGNTTAASNSGTNNIVLTATANANAWGIAGEYSDNQRSLAGTGAYVREAAPNPFITLYDSNTAVSAGSYSMTLDNSTFTGGGGTGGEMVFINESGSTGGGGGGGGGGNSGTTTLATSTVIRNDNNDLASGFEFFFMWMVFIVWLLRKH